LEKRRNKQQLKQRHIVLEKNLEFLKVHYDQKGKNMDKQKDILIRNRRR